MQKSKFRIPGLEKNMRGKGEVKESQDLSICGGKCQES
jgi:hypothetical protein